MKITIVTVVLNAADTIADALDSVASQTHGDVEHIVIDGGSTDGTLEIIKRSNSVAQLVSEPDGGLYDAMNKGIRMASGAVIGMLNADDVYEHQNVLAKVAATLEDPQVDACYADLVYVKANNLERVVRTWRSRDFRPGLCWRGWMPAHPTLFCKREVYQRVGDFDLKLRFQADLEFCARAFEVHEIRSRYIPELWVRMRLGGVTNNSFKAMVVGNWESYRALRRLGMKRNPVSYFVIKFSSRLRQFF